MPATEYLNPDTLPNPGGRYNQIVKKGNMVFIAGQTAVDKDGNLVGAGDPAAQARQVYTNLEAAIRSVGGKPSDILKTTTYLTSLDYLVPTRPARQAFYGDHLPTSTMLIISGLADPAYVIEVEAIAILDD